MELKNMRIAILTAEGFEQVELTEPKSALEKAGAEALIVSPERDKVRSWHNGNWGNDFNVDILVDNATTDDFNGLLLPGGVFNADKLRINQNAVNFVRKIVEQNKPIAVICHGPWILVNAQSIKGRRITSWPSLQLDLINAGANWVDEKAVIDNEHNIISSRKPDDIPDFNIQMIKLFYKYWYIEQQM